LFLVYLTLAFRIYPPAMADSHTVTNCRLAEVEFEAPSRLNVRVAVPGSDFMAVTQMLPPVLSPTITIVRDPGPVPLNVPQVKLS